MIHPRTLRTGCLLLAATTLAGCPSARGRGSAGDPCRVDAGEGNRPFLSGNPERREQVEALVATLGTVRGEELLTTGRKILCYGDAAVPPLLAALRSDDPIAREHAAYLLGARKDRRTIPDLVRATCDDAPRVRYEAAAALLEMKDPSGLCALLGGLEDPDARMRAKSIEVLQSATGQRFGFEADGDPVERAAALRRWRAWLEQREAEPDPAGDLVPPTDPIEAGERTRQPPPRPKDPLGR